MPSGGSIKTNYCSSLVEQAQENKDNQTMTYLLPDTSRTCRSSNLPNSCGSRNKRLSRKDKTLSRVHLPISTGISVILFLSILNTDILLNLPIDVGKS